MTIHGSKGLEFKVIILIKFTDIMLQHQQTEQSIIINQNMNLLYVAITRAISKLYIYNETKQPLCTLIHGID